MRLIDLFLALAPLIVVPLARPLLHPDRLPRPRLVVSAAVLFAVAFIPTARGGAAWLTVPWLAVTVAALLAAGIAAVRAREISVAALAILATYGYLVIAAFNATASRAGWNPVGTAEPIVELTGIHFNYAGFATMVLAGCVARHPRVPRPWATIALVLGIAGPPITAIGFIAENQFFQVGGAVVMTAFAWMVAGLTARYVVATSPTRARTLLVISSLSVVAPMVLAVFWAAANYADVPALSIVDMARIHGSLNALGFVGCGLLGWRVREGQMALRSSTTARQRSGSLRYGA